jgi:hypothetical protein
MGTYRNIKDDLSDQFSIFQLMSLLRMDAQEVRKVRNLLRQFKQKGFVKRISKNMYEKLEK